MRIGATVCVLAVVPGCGASPSEVPPDTGSSSAESTGAAATTSGPVGDPTSSVGSLATTSNGSGGPTSGSTGASPTSSDDSTTGSLDCGSDWWDSGWLSRLPLVVPANKVSANLTEVPLLVVLDGTRLGGAPLTPEELRFVDAAGTLRPHEIESWDYPDRSFVWVRVSSLSARQNTRLWMYFSTSDVPDVQAPADVWANYLAVYHFTEGFSDAAQQHDGFSDHLPAPTESVIGGGVRFDGTDDYVELPDESDFNLANALSISLWMRRSGWSHTYETLIAKGDNSWRLHRDNNAQPLEFANHRPSGGTDDLGGSTEVTDDQWHHVAIVYGGGGKALYIDGVLDTNNGYTEGLATSSFPVFLGENSETTGRFFGGDMDEVRISGIPRSPEWIALQYRSMTDDLLDFEKVEACR